MRSWKSIASFKKVSRVKILHFLKSVCKHTNLFSHPAITNTGILNSFCMFNQSSCWIERPKLIFDVNYYKDYLFIKQIYEYFLPQKKNFTASDVVKWYEKKYSRKELN